MRSGLSCAVRGGPTEPALPATVDSGLLESEQDPGVAAEDRARQDAVPPLGAQQFDVLRGAIELIIDQADDLGFGLCLDFESVRLGVGVDLDRFGFRVCGVHPLQGDEALALEGMLFTLCVLPFLLLGENGIAVECREVDVFDLGRVDVDREAGHDVSSCDCDRAAPEVRPELQDMREFVGPVSPSILPSDCFVRGASYTSSLGESRVHRSSVDGLER